MKRRGWAWTVGAVLIGSGLLGSLQATGRDNPASEAKTAKVGEPAPDFKAKDVYGKAFTLSEFKDKIVVLEWINQDCPVSKGAHDKGTMQEVYKKYAGKGVVWLGVDSTAGMTAEKNRVYAAAMGLAYPILMDGDGKIGHSYQAKRTPHMYVIDRGGKLAYAGAIDDRKDKNYVAAAIDDLLADRPVAKPQTDAYGCTVKYAK